MPFSIPHTPVYSRPLSRSGAATAYTLLALALFLTGVGILIGATFAPIILRGGFLFLLAIAELAIVWTAPSWSRTSPTNVLLFITFPILSGITITPFILSVAIGYVNGAMMLLNATIATTLLTLSSAVAASMSQRDLGLHYGFMVMQGLIGLLIFGLLQVFFPSLRGGPIETMMSGLGVVLFAVFLAIDFQRLQRQGQADSPFLLALSLYLDIFNLFLYVVRFMLSISDRHR